MPGRDRGAPAATPAEHGSRPHSLAQALPFYLAGGALLTFMDVLIKQVSVNYATAQVAFLRYVFGFLLIAAITAYVRPGWPSGEAIRVNGVRSLLAVAMSLCFFFALKTLPLGETIALSFLSPVFLALFGSWFLGEQLTGRIWLALGIGFLGMLAIVSGKLEGAGTGEMALLGAGAAFISALFYALSAVLLRSRAVQDKVTTIVFIQNLGPAVILALPAIWVWRAPDAYDLGQFAAIGSIGTCGHLMLSHAFARAEAARLAPFEYTALIWGGLFGFLFFGEVPAAMTLAGVGLIVVGAVVAGRKGR